MRAVLEVFLGWGLTYMLESNLQDSARATSLDFPGGPLTHDEQFFLKNNMWKMGKLDSEQKKYWTKLTKWTKILTLWIGSKWCLEWWQKDWWRRCSPMLLLSKSTTLHDWFSSNRWFGLSLQNPHPQKSHLQCWF